LINLPTLSTASINHIASHRIASQSPTMSSANQLFLLADHIKLSLLERQRAKNLNLEGDSQDGHISRSFDQFRDGLANLRDEEQRLTFAGETE